MLVSFLLQKGNLDLMPTLKNAKVSQLRLTKSYTICCKSSALAAFTKMAFYKTELLQIVDQDGYVLDVITFRDIEGLGAGLEKMVHVCS